METPHGFRFAVFAVFVVFLVISVVFSATLVSAPLHAADDPLLVVVETPSGAGLDAAVVRRAIVAELGTAVVAPTDPEAQRASRVLVVAFDGRRIAMSLRNAADETVARSVAAPPYLAADLRAIAWLAGNLVRDQVSGAIAVAAVAAPAEPPLARSPAPSTGAPHDGIVAREPPPLPVPPPLSESPAVAPPQSPAISARATAAASPPSRAPLWTVAAAAGPTVLFRPAVWEAGLDGAWDFGRAYQFVVQRQPADGGLTFGAAFDLGPHDGLHLFGVAGLVGSGWSGRRWFVDASVGLGLEAMRQATSHYQVINSSSMGTSSTTVVTDDLTPVFYARAVGTLGVPISRSFDAIASVGLYAMSLSLDSDFASASIGMRLRLP